MKTTIEIPDELYRQVKARAALQGRSVREVTEELYRRWLFGGAPAPSEDDAKPWADDWIALSDELMRKAPSGPTARERLEADRGRLDRRRS